MVEPVLPGFIEVLKQQGIFEVYLPFLLTFAIFYGLLKKLNIFGATSDTTGKPLDTTGNKIAALVALIAAAYVTIFSPAAIPISQFFSSFFAQASVTMVTLLVLIMILGILIGPFYSTEDTKNLWGNIISIGLPIALLVVLAIFFTSGGDKVFAKFAPSIGFTPEDLTLLVLIIITIVIIVIVVGGAPKVSTWPWITLGPPK